MDRDFHEFLAALLAHRVRFLVVGAHALAVHGVPRATGDLDAWEDRLEHGLGGLRVPFLGRSSLIRNKRASGRPKDLSDLDQLGATS